MDFSVAYLKKIREHSASLKSKNLPLISWDIHLQNIANLTKYQSDIFYIKKFIKHTKIESDLLKEYSENNSVLVITDLDLNIEYASHNMLEMTGYKPIEVIGKSPKMFQGPETDVIIAKSIRESVVNKENFDYTLINYKKDNSTYSCHIKGFPVYDRKNELIKFVAIEREVA